MTATLPAPSPTAGPRPAPTRALGRTRAHSAAPAWVRPGVAGLLLATALLYLWGLGASGWANSFYSAAAQAGSQSWTALFFGSSDAGNSITVDKTPASLWLMGISVRIFGLSSWSILAPEALCGAAAVGVLYLAVRRWFGPAAGLLAGATMALTPVAVLMFRFNNPDALLVLLLVVGAYAVTRAVETASTRWLLLAGTVVGLGFLTKMMQAVLVVPAFALAYLIAAPAPLRRRVWQVLAAGGAMIAGAGWWVAIVELIPASARPYIGGSQTNSVLELAFGYNGLGRITGDEVGSVGGGGGPTGGSIWGATGLTRLFNTENGGQISWLIPSALILLVAGLALAGRASRLDRTRAALILWGGWLLVTGVTFSLMAGIFHPYYSVALAPAIGAVVGIGTVVLWRRVDLVATLALAASIAATAVWSWTLLKRSPDWHPWLAPTVLIGGLLAAGLLVAVRHRSALARPRASGWAAGAVLAGGLAAMLLGPAAYAVQTAGTAHAGAIPSAGPAVAGAGFGPGRGGGFAGGQGGFAGGQGGFAGGQSGPRLGPAQGGGLAGGPVGGGGRGGIGGLLDAQAPSAALITLLQTDASSYRWAAAAVGSNNAAGLQLGSGESVMPIGGFNGSDPSPTLAEFQQYVQAGQIHYFIGGGGFGNATGSQSGSAIAAWVEQNFAATTVGGTTVYDLSPAAGHSTA